MNIRTITAFLAGEPSLKRVSSLSQKLHELKKRYEAHGWNVQTVRIAFEKWDHHFGQLSFAEQKKEIENLDRCLVEQQIDFCSVGPTEKCDQVDALADLLPLSDRMSGSSLCAHAQKGFDFEQIKKTAQAVLKLSQVTEYGLGNFRFAACFALNGGVPYFPVAYQNSDHDGFALGFENSDIFVKAMKEARSFERAQQALDAYFCEQLSQIEKISYQLEKKLSINYFGIDTSLAPSLASDESIVEGFKALDIDFSQRGTLALVALITRVLQSLPVKKIGYCGLMLPVLEDVGLCQLANQKELTLNDLLMFSSVCGVGIDTVPLAGDVSVESLAQLYLDTASLALKWDKPLAVRVLPIQGKRGGEMTEFNFPHMSNCRILSVNR